MRLRIEFSGRRLPPRASSALLFLIGISVAAAAAWDYAEAYGEQRTAAQALAGARLQARGPSFTLPPRQIDALNRSVRQLNLPWQPLLAAIEERLSEHVTLLSLEPDASARLLRLQAEAKSANDMVDFVEALNSDERFVSAKLTRHEINDSDRNRPYRFFLEAEWSGDL